MIKIRLLGNFYTENAKGKELKTMYQSKTVSWHSQRVFNYKSSSTTKDLFPWKQILCIDIKHMKSD
jgi:hypothetical protein